MIGMRSLYEIRYGGRLITSTFANSADEAREKALREAYMLGHYRDTAPYIMRGEVSRVIMNKTGGKRTAKRRATNKAGTRRTAKRSSNRAGTKRRNRAGTPKRSARTGRFVKAR